MRHPEYLVVGLAIAVAAILGSYLFARLPPFEVFDPVRTSDHVQERIRRRYRSIQDKWFPLSLVIAVPAIVAGIVLAVR